jgi:hypothetical protein
MLNAHQVASPSQSSDTTQFSSQTQSSQSSTLSLVRSRDSGVASSAEIPSSPLDRFSPATTSRAFFPSVVDEFGGSPTPVFPSSPLNHLSVSNTKRKRKRESIKLDDSDSEIEVYGPFPVQRKITHKRQKRSSVIIDLTKDN